MIIFHTIMFILCLGISLSYIKDEVVNGKELTWSVIATVLNFICILLLI